MAQKFTVPITVKQLNSASSDAVSVFVDADTHPRLKLDAGGRLTWGDGTANGDVTLYRDGVNSLKTDDDLTVSGALKVTASSGPEGGEIQLAAASTGTTLSGPIKVDIYENRLRFFEGGGSNRGAYIDLTATAGGAGTNLLGTSGAMNYAQTVGSKQSNISTPGTTIVSVSITTNGYPVQVVVTGDVENNSAGGWTVLQLYRGSTAIGNPVHTEGSAASENAPYALTVIDTPAAGTYTYALKLNNSAGGTFNFGESNGPVITAVELAGKTGAAGPAGDISTSSIDDLSDVVIASPEEFQSLSYNGTSWVNGHIPVVSYVRNAESTTLTTGTCVYLYGATGDHATVKRADNNSDTTSSKTIGVVGANITASNNGPVITRGYVDGIDLSSGYAAGDILWLGENGAFTTTKPSAPDHLVFIGVVVRATNNGIIYVATQNGYELDELHNVAASSPSAGDFLKYNGSLWVNDPINLGTDTVGNYVASLVAGTGITLSNNSGEGATPTVSIDDTAVATLTGTQTLSNKTLSNPTILGSISLPQYIIFEGSTDDAYETVLSVVEPTGDRLITLPNRTGTVITDGDTGTVTSTMIADGTIVNGDISSSAAIAHSKLANATPGQVLLGTTTSGVVTATTISGDITIDGAGVATIAANSVALGTDTTGNYVSSLVAGTGITLTNNSGESATPTIAVTSNTYDAYNSARNVEIKLLMEVI